jgi:hypothetical protein
MPMFMVKAARCRLVPERFVQPQGLGHHAAHQAAHQRMAGAVAVGAVGQHEHQNEQAVVYARLGGLFHVGFDLRQPPHEVLRFHVLVHQCGQTGLQVGPALDQRHFFNVGAEGAQPHGAGGTGNVVEALVVPQHLVDHRRVAVGPDLVFGLQHHGKVHVELFAVLFVADDFALAQQQQAVRVPEVDRQRGVEFDFVERKRNVHEEKMGFPPECTTDMMPAMKLTIMY